MVSFDVESLFTNVPIVGTVEAARQKLESDASPADRTTLTCSDSGLHRLRIEINILTV